MASVKMNKMNTLRFRVLRRLTCVFEEPVMLGNYLFTQFAEAEVATVSYRRRHCDSITYSLTNHYCSSFLKSAVCTDYLLVLGKVLHHILQCLSTHVYTEARSFSVSSYKRHPSNV